MFTTLPQSGVIALDLETTGLDIANDRIVEMAAVRWQDGCESAVFQALVNPGIPIPAETTAIHGITDAMVAGQPPLAARLPDFLAFCQGEVVVAHNAKFDLGFLRTACARTGHTLFTIPAIDTVSLARRRLPGLPNYRLETLKQVLGRGPRQSHRALHDARDCLALYLHCAHIALPSPPPGAVKHPPDAGHLALLRAALGTGRALMIEYQDGRGRTTRRAIHPMAFDARCEVVEAYCLLRRDTRQFYLDRIRRVWASDGALL